MYPCPDGCPRTYSSLKAALLCPCDKYDQHGHELGGSYDNEKLP